MSTQFHVAHSKDIMGMAAIAGCAFYCANANIPTALLCSKGFAVVPELIAATTFAELTLSIDNTRNMEDDKIWLFSGTYDDVVATGLYFTYYK